MLRFAVSRALHGIVVLLAVTILVFIVSRVIGNPVLLSLPIDASPEQVVLRTHQLGFDRPLVEQFGTYLWNLIHLDFGVSIWRGQPAVDLVLQAIPRTAVLVLVAIAVAGIVAIPLGIASARRPGGAIDRAVTFLSLLGLSVPQFWLGLLLILLFAVNLGWLPTSGSSSPTSILLPAATIALPVIGQVAVMTRSSMIDQLNSDYIDIARSKGLSRFRVVFVHAFRNAAVPSLTLLAWELIRALSGTAVVVETIFAWPGIGTLSLGAIQNRDPVLLQAIVIFVAFVVVVINYCVDLLYKWVDPRISLGG